MLFVACAPVLKFRDTYAKLCLRTNLWHPHPQVNGCSVGIHAAVMAVAGPGDTLLVARNCHQSAFAAMTLAGVC